MCDSVYICNIYMFLCIHMNRNVYIYYKNYVYYVINVYILYVHTVLYFVYMFMCVDLV